MLLTLQHTESGSASLLWCCVHGIHTRVCSHLTTQSGGSKLFECINNANKLCHLGSQPRGIILLGDSAGAHFHIPPEWITASQMSLVSNFVVIIPDVLAFVFVSPLLSINAMPVPNRCRFPSSAQSAVKGTSTAFSVQLSSDSLIRTTGA